MCLQKDILKSWAASEGKVNSTSSILAWIEDLNRNTHVKITECKINAAGDWFYDTKKGIITNHKGAFFTVQGIKYYLDGECVEEQPIIVQNEIGYLGIICKKIDGVLHFLMQAKIEPGNVNCVQISPTIQATKSNFTRRHGGTFPPYLEYFKNAGCHHVIYDQVQSEQSSRFYKKRNRNMIIEVNEAVEVYYNYKWMTLGQIKELMQIDNLVNMDTRTVLSGLPLMCINSALSLKDTGFSFKDNALLRSMLETNPLKELPEIFGHINTYKMMKETSGKLVPLYELDSWQIDENGLTSKEISDFTVRYYDIEIDGREVKHWAQPLFKALGKATFGLIVANDNGIKKILVKLRAEVGAFDKVELGPSIQWEPTHCESDNDVIETVFQKYLNEQRTCICDVILSEEGGRFYHEENRNIVIEINEVNDLELPDGYMWASYSTLNYMVQFHNCLNIQLRNLLSLLPL